MTSLSWDPSAQLSASGPRSPLQFSPLNPTLTWAMLVGKPMSSPGTFLSSVIGWALLRPNSLSLICQMNVGPVTKPVLLALLGYSGTVPSTGKTLPWQCCNLPCVPFLWGAVPLFLLPDDFIFDTNTVALVTNITLLCRLVVFQSLKAHQEHKMSQFK